MKIKHIGRGYWSMIDADGTRVGPVGKKEDIEAWVARGATFDAKEPVAGPQAPANAASQVDMRQYREALRQARANAAAPILNELRAPLAKHFDGYILDRVMRRIEPIVKNPNRRHKAI